MAPMFPSVAEDLVRKEKKSSTAVDVTVEEGF